MDVTRRLAEFVAGTRSEGIPGAARVQARRTVLDTLGVMLAGSREDASRIVAGYVRDQGGEAEATVAGWRFRAPAAQAALANGTSGHALDFDDVSVSMRGHPSVPLLPAVLALGEKLARNGRDVLEAFVLGFEVQARLGRAIGEPHYALGWHATSTLGSVGAAVASARLLTLDTDRTQAALSIAASLAGGLQQNFGTMAKPVHAGWAAHNGVVAALLAQRGLTAGARGIEGASGFLRAMSGGAEIDTDEVTRGLGDSWDIVSPGIGVKLYPCCYATHRAIDAALAIRERRRIDPTKLSGIVAIVSPGTLLPLIDRPPSTGLEGKFSLGYCIAAAFLDGRVSLASFTDEAVRRPGAQELISLVEVREEGAPAKFPIGGVAEVRVTLVDGNEHFSRVDIPRGDPERPLSWDELVTKFRECSGLVLSPERVEEAVRLAERLDLVEDVRELVAVISGD